MTDQPTPRETRKPDFPAVVHTYTDALRWLRDNGAASDMTVAKATNRVVSNVRRDFNRLINAGVISPSAPGLYLITDLGRQWVMGQDVADGLAPPPSATDTAADALPEGLLSLRHDQILPDPDNARQDWTSEEARWELDALRMDIVQNGLLQNLVVRPMADDDLQDAFVQVTTPAGDEILPRYRLVAGERRWRAIGEAIADGDWPEDRPILARLLDADAKETRFAAIAENLLRRKLNPIEKAKGFEQLAALGFENKLIAERLGYTPEHVQQHRRFLKLDEADQQRMTLPRDDPRHLSVRDARQKLAVKDNAPKAVALEPIARLALAELIHAVFAAATHRYAMIPVAAGADQTPEAIALLEHDFIRFDGLRDYGEHAGRFVMGLGYGSPLLDPPLPDMFGDYRSRDAALISEQARVYPDGVPADDDCINYATPWIQTVGDLTPEGQAIVDEIATRKAERDAEDQQRQAALAEKRAAGEAIASAARAFQADVRAAAVLHLPAARTQEIAVTAEAPLPWRIRWDGAVVAADGAIIISGNPHLNNTRSEARMRLMIVGVNTAAGLSTPDDEPEPTVDAPDQAAFEQSMADTVHLFRDDLDDEAALDQAVKILAAFLDDNGVAFGDDGFDWTEQGAASLVEAHFEALEDDNQDEAA